MVSFGGKAPSGWQQEIHDIAVQFMTGEVCFYREKPSTVPYNPITGEGGEDGVEIIWRGKARIQQLRTPREYTTPYQASASRNFRFQLDPDDNLPRLYEGAKARVTNAGRDDALTTYLFVVNSAVNSSDMAVRTVELISNMKAVDWTWDPEDYIPFFPSGLLYPSLELYPVGA